MSGDVGSSSLFASRVADGIEAALVIGLPVPESGSPPARVILYSATLRLYSSLKVRDWSSNGLVEGKSPGKVAGYLRWNRSK